MAQEKRPEACRSIGVNADPGRGAWLNPPQKEWQVVVLGGKRGTSSGWSLLSRWSPTSVVRRAGSSAMASLLGRQ